MRSHLQQSVHHAARYRIYKLSKCAANGNHRSITAGQRRFEVYLAHLQPHTRMEWENRLAIDLQSVQAYNHGIGVHRQQEASKIEQYLEDYQWVTVLGLSRLGKTHLAWQVASKWCKVHNWSMYFCDVTDCETPASWYKYYPKRYKSSMYRKMLWIASFVNSMVIASIFNTIRGLIFNHRHSEYLI